MRWSTILSGTFVLGSLLCAGLAEASTARVAECRALQHVGRVPQAKACFQALTRAPQPFVRAAGYEGLNQYDSANTEFKLAYKQNPKDPEVLTEWGNLFFERFNPTEAVNLLNEAVAADANYAPAYLGLAHLAAEGYSKKAVEFAHTALEHDPKLVEAHELLAYLALEDSDRQLAKDEAEKSLALSNEALEGMAILGSMDFLDGNLQSPWMDKMLKVNPVYGEGFATGAHFLVINHRYQEGIAEYRKALSLQPDLWSARSQLGINLMRLGEESEAKAELNRSYQAHYRDPQTVNALRLLDKLKDYSTTRTPTTELTLDKHEASLLQPYIEPEMQRAVETYQRKYKMTLPGPVKLDVYPNHEDFVVRILGLPGQGGLLGVTFGLVVAMDSPSARPPGEFNWASTMWHEMSHVFVLTATHNLVPRWFTEGLAVHEESAISASWGDRMTPEMVMAVRDKKLLPVLELDKGFVRSDYPGQVLVSYFEAGRMCDFITEKWGDAATLGMIHSYAARKTTAEAIQDNLHESPAAFDKEFLAWLDRQTSKAVKNFDAWKTGIKTAHASLEAGKPKDAIAQGLAVHDYYPDYIGPNSLYQTLAEAYEKTNDKAAAMKELEAYRDKGGANVGMLRSLAKSEADAGKTDEAEKTLTKLLYIYPEDEETHRMLGGLLINSSHPAKAIREYEAVLALKTADSAEAHYDLAKALQAAHRSKEAKDQVLTALETAPDYKPAQQLLLQLSQE